MSDYTLFCLVIVGVSLFVVWIAYAIPGEPTPTPDARRAYCSRERRAGAGR